MRSCLVRRFLVCCGVVIGAGCTKDSSTPRQSGASSPVKSGIRFTDVTTDSGINFQHVNGAFGLRLMPETIGSGVCVFDYDADGWPDIYFVNSREWTPEEIEAYFSHQGRPQRGKVALPQARRKVTGALYRNMGNGRFTDVTQGSGLAIESFGQGACAADYDADGRTDLYVTAWPRNYLFRNKGGGKFEEVAERAGVLANNWSAVALWLDFNKDGHLDLFVGRYLKWSPEQEKYNTATGANGVERAYGGPDLYEGLTAILYRNRGDGTFQDVSLQAGIATKAVDKGNPSPLTGKTLGAVALDYDRDGWPDIAVCNDRIRNFLFHNRQGKFEEVAQPAGIAFSNEGAERAGMGVDAADIDHSAFESVAVGNFDKEMLGLFQNIQGKAFYDVALLSDAGRASHNRLTFGCVFADFDNDTLPDIATANGHIQPGVDGVRRDTSHAQEPLLLKNLGPRKAPSSITEGKDFSYAAFAEPAEWIAEVPRFVGRGLASADFDRDGDVDLIFTSNGGPAYLLRNDSTGQGHALRVVARSAAPNREAIGAVIWSEPGKFSLRRTIRAGHSFASQSELPVTFGLGAHDRVRSLTIRWPSGKTSTFNDVDADQELIISEEKGIMSRASLQPKSG